MIVSPATRLYAVVGDPVAHSLSPMIHNRWIAEAGLNAVYVALHLRTDHASADLKALARSGFCGLNITLPHKRAAFEAGEIRSPEAQSVGAANTLSRNADGAWAAHNTDVEGFSNALLAATAVDPMALKGRRVVLIGAGGAARAALVCLKRLGADIAIVNRSIANAESLANDLAPGAETAGFDDLAELASEAAIVVNTASLGHAGADLPDLPAGEGRPFLDMSYGKAAAGILAAARDAGWTPHDGLTMLVGQAAAAFRIWFGVSPDVAGALTACRTEVDRAAAESR
jgi:shikimate dehydrogenase